MANNHCAQCSDTRNIYIKTCDCSKERVNQQIDTKTNSIKKEFINSSAVDQKKIKCEQPRLRAVKAVVYRVVRVYETVPSKTMKIVGALTLLLLIVAVFSVALAQNKEETKSQYGMAFPLEDASPLNSEQRISIIGSVPGEGQSQTVTQESTSESPVPTTVVPTTEDSITTTEDSEKKILDQLDSDNQNNESHTFLISNPEEDDDKNGEDNGEEKINPRLVFIERLMGLHLSAPFNGQPKENEKEENSAVESEPQFPIRNPFDKVNAKWSTRMRKFTIPLMQQQPQPPETPNPLLRVAAAAMMTRLLAAAARAQNNGQMMGKDKDDDAEEETVPILLATMRSDENDRDEQMGGRPIPPMYGRPMPRPPMMRPPVRPPLRLISQSQQRMASINVPQRVYASAQVMPQRGPIMQRAALPPVQPVLVMLAHVPMPMQMAESRMGNGPVHYNHYMSPQQQHSLPVYPQMPYNLPYNLGYHPMQRQMTIPVEVPTPVHVPVPVPVASYHRSIYQSPYQTGQTYQRQSSVSRPVIEIPIEIPVPVHVPVPVSYHNQGSQGSHYDPDHEPSATESDQVAIVYYDPEANDGPNDEGSDHLEPQTSESHENSYSMAPTQKGYPYISRPMPNIQSATKLKLWREYVGAKHAAQPGVRYIPVAVSNEDAHTQTQTGIHDNNDSHMNPDQTEAQESQSHQAFVILSSEDSPDGQHHH